VDSASLTAALVTGPTHGSLVLNPDGSFAYRPAANYFGDDSFTYRASDGQADSQAALVSLTIAPVNDAPAVAAVQGSVTANEGDTASNSGTFSDVDGDTVILTASIGTLTQGAGTWTWSYTSTDGPDDTRPVTITATDEHGAASSIAFDLVVANVAPHVSAGDDQTVAVGAAVVFAGSFTDPGQADTHTLRWDFGDGTSAVGTLTPTHAYADSGVYTVTLIVTDDDGGTTADSLVITALGGALGVEAGPDQATEEGTAVAVAGTVTGASSAESLTYTWDFGDGTTAETLAASHVYVDNGIYTATLTVTNGRGGRAADSLVVTVTNVAPTVELTGPASGVRGQARSFAGSVTDPGVLDTHLVAWNFGDGTAMAFQPATGQDALSPTHVYAATGTYTVTLTVQDDDGGVDTAQRAIVVKAVDLQPSPCDPSQTALVVGGTEGDDKIHVSLQGSPHGGCHGKSHGRPAEIEVKVNKTSYGPFAPTGGILVFAQGGDDEVQVTGNITLSTFIDGGTGDDRLNAGTGPAVLLGGPGDDMLLGGAGRSILVGGQGADRLVGQAGDDILIAARTAYDTDLSAWCVILHEWARTDASYGQRVAHLTIGGGLNGDRVLTGTAPDDRAHDRLTGASGCDWFLAATQECGGDAITDRHYGETVTPLAPAMPAPVPHHGHHGGCRHSVDWDFRWWDRNEHDHHGSSRIDWETSYCEGREGRARGDDRKQHGDGCGFPDWDVWLRYL